MSVFTEDTRQKGHRQLTYDTKWLPGEAESSLPSSVATAASCRPDADDVLQPEHHNHHKLLFNETETAGVLVMYDHASVIKSCGIPITDEEEQTGM